VANRRGYTTAPPTSIGRPSSNQLSNYHPTSLGQGTVNRPTINQPIINRTTNISSTGPTTVNNSQIANTTVNNFTRNTVNNVGNVGVNNIAVNNFGRPWGTVHSGWYSGSWGSGWPAFPGVWAGQGFAGSGFAGTGFVSDFGTAMPMRNDFGWTAPAALSSTVVFNNPYFAASSFSSTTVESPGPTLPSGLDYSQPIAVPTQAQQENEDEDIVAEAKKEFARARTAFKGTLYRTALYHAEAGLKLLPGDTTMHEFRAQCLFALGRYQEATGALYAVLNAGPGWDWNTMASLYADTETYTKQLRRLEKHVRESPKDPRGHFLLGYHYLVLDERDAAADEFGHAARLQPRDKLSASLAAALTTRPSDQKAPEE
jgi:hypothetical protein